MKKKESCSPCTSRLGKVGGQAVLEGVMMKAGDRAVTTCRKEDGSLVVTDDSFVSVRKKHKILDIPILRGIIAFIESMVLSVKTLGASADAMGLEEEEPGRFEKWLRNKLGMRVTDVIMVISTILGLALSVLLFVYLPVWISYGINALLLWLFGVELGVFSAVLEGIVKVGIFLAYLSLVSLMPDIKRTFMYHGAEHKSIACFESGDELTPENAKKHSRFHPRCGTSFMFFMILIGIIAGLFIKILFPGLKLWVYMLIRLAILPLVAGLGFEIIRFAGKHPNIITRAISAPGLWVQRITTKEPTEDMLEVAITSIKCALRDDFEEFSEFYNARAWEKPAESQASPDEPTENKNEDSPAEAEKSPEKTTEVPAETAEAPAENATDTGDGIQDSTASESQNENEA